MAGDADDAPGVDRRAGASEDLAGLFVLDIHAGPFQDFERPKMDVGEVVVGQYAELAAVAACASRMGVPSHERTSFAQSWASRDASRQPPESVIASRIGFKRDITHSRVCVTSSRPPMQVNTLGYPTDDPSQT